jgi:hypothetical protein
MFEISCFRVAYGPLQGVIRVFYLYFGTNQKVWGSR